MTTRFRLVFVLLLIAGFALNLVPLWWGLPGYPTWAPDELQATAVLHPGQWPLKYPPFHRQLLTPILRPLDAALRATGMETEFVARIAILQAVARAVSLLMGTALIWLTYRYGRLLVDRRSALLGAAVVAFSPPFVYYAKTANLDTPYVFWFTVSLIFLLRAALDGRMRDHLLFGVAAALAVATKDQAYALYLAAPLPLILGHWRRRSPADGVGPLRRLLAYRGLWAAIAAGAVVLIAIFRLPFELDRFLEHVRLITGPKSAGFRTFEPTWVGHAQMLGRAVSNFGFALGLPWLVAFVVGGLLALRERRRAWLVASVGALGIGYYLGFVGVIGYHYVRFFLPLVVLAAPIAAWGLMQALDRPRWRRAVPVLIALALLFQVVRAVSVDAAMLRDSRRAAEELLADQALRPTLGIGRGNALPYGVDHVDWGSVGTRGCGAVRGAHRSLVVNATDLRSEEEQDWFDSIASGQLGFDEVARLPERSGVRGLRLAGVDSNFALLNPDLRILARADRPCLDRSTLPDFLAHLRDERNTRSTEVLVQTMRAERLTTRIVGQDPRIDAVHLRHDGWTYGTQPAAVSLEAPPDHGVTPRLELGCWAPDSDYPVRATLDDGRARRVVEFTRDGRRTLSLEPLEPGQSAVVLIWADKAWSGRERQPRPLGVNLLDVRLAPTTASSR
jgi:hypothetical protein